MHKRILILLLQLSTLSGIAQTQVTDQDTSRKSILTYLRTFIKDEAAKSTEEFQEDKISLNQGLSLEKILQSTRSAKEYLKTGIDTIALQAQLTDIKEK